LGILDNGEVICKYYKVDFLEEDFDNLIFINSKLCISKKFLTDKDFEFYKEEIEKTENKEPLSSLEEEICSYELDEWKKELVNEIDKKLYFTSSIKQPKNVIKKLHLKLKIPKGKLGDVAKTLNYINQKFDKVELELKIDATDGEISKSEYEDKIKKSFSQSGIEVEEGL
jgi:hypothetical protein